MMILLMALMGGLGAVCRFVADGEIKLRHVRAFPLATFMINCVGSLVLGMLTGLAARHGLSADGKLALGTGFCGGFTTFSTAMVEVVLLVREPRVTLAGAYLLATAVVCVALAAAGYLIL